MITLHLSNEKFNIALGRQLMTRNDICRKTGITEGNLSTMLKRGTVRPKTAGLIAKALEVDITDIIVLSGETNEEENDGNERIWDPARS